MINAFEDPRLTKDIEPYLQFEVFNPGYDYYCLSLILASKDIYPNSDALDEARNAFVDKNPNI